jgi:hypothetical protein
MPTAILRAQRGDTGALPGGKAKAAKGTASVEGDPATAEFAGGLAATATERIIGWATPTDTGLATAAENATGSSFASRGGCVLGRVGEEALERAAGGSGGAAAAGSGTGARCTLICTTLSAMPLCCSARGGFKLWVIGGRE